MEGKKNLCAMIPAELHARIMAEKEEMELATFPIHQAPGDHERA